MPQSQLVPVLSHGTTSPLTAPEWYQMGFETLAVAAVDNLAPAIQAAWQAAGGWAKLYQWPGQVIAWGGLQAPFKKITKKAITSGATYWRQQQAQKLTLADYETWLNAVSAEVNLPLAQPAPYYGPVDDIDRVVEVNLAWQNQHAWGVIQGAGLKRARQRSVQGLLDQGVQNFVLGGLSQHLPFEEWQRIGQDILAMLPAKAQTMIFVDSLAELKQAQAWRIDYLLTDLPQTWYRHHQIFWKGQVMPVDQVDDPSLRLLQASVGQKNALGERLLLTYNWQVLNNLLKNID